MSKVHLAFFTDPHCPWSWAVEPHLRCLEVEFGERLEVTFVLVGLARAIDAPLGAALALQALDAACDLPRPRVEAELWRAADEWRARPEPAGGGFVWSGG